MKPAHRLDLFARSRYLHLAFNGSRWARAAGNVLEGHGAHAEQLQQTAPQRSVAPRLV